MYIHKRHSNPVRQTPIPAQRTRTLTDTGAFIAAQDGTARNSLEEEKSWAEVHKLQERAVSVPQQRESESIAHCADLANTVYTPPVVERPKRLEANVTPWNYQVIAPERQLFSKHAVGQALVEDTFACHCCKIPLVRIEDKGR